MTSKNKFIGSFFFHNGDMYLRDHCAMSPLPTYGQILDKVGSNSYLIESLVQGHDQKRKVVNARVFSEFTRIFSTRAEMEKFSVEFRRENKSR